MVIKKTIQVIYAPGTFGNCVRWMLDRFYKNSNFKDVDSPWDDDGRVHGFEEKDYNPNFTRAHQMNGKDHSPDADAHKVVINFNLKDFLFVERCGFYRLPGHENEKERYKSIINFADASFVKETFGDTSFNKNVAKELTKIQFHNIKNHKWWNSMNKLLADKNNHQFDMYSLWNEDMLKNEISKVSEKFQLNLDIDDKVIHNVVNETKKSYPVVTRKRAHLVLDDIVSKKNTDCEELDIIEQAYIEAELEKIHDHIIFPYGTNWFKDTTQINLFLDTYPSYLKHMNPRLPWYNNINNPFYLTGRIDKSK